MHPVSGPVHNVIVIPEKNVTCIRSITVKWDPPAPIDFNGILTTYYVDYTRNDTVSTLHVVN